MRREDQAKLLQVRHHVAHRGWRQRDRQQPRQITRAERLAGGQIALDNLAENFTRALVERGEAYLVRADRDVVGNQRLNSLYPADNGYCGALVQAKLMVMVCAETKKMPNP